MKPIPKEEVIAFGKELDALLQKYHPAVTDFLLIYQDGSHMGLMKARRTSTEKAAILALLANRALTDPEIKPIHEVK